ncbi:hypothetical protein ABZZ47_22065 [Streptomyces sp. NPDC006465]|uniref:hypothetical protein n=1 Tax=Streptomyces sp. NPDC006465 TaxID=3157174 RepID=UPI0033AF8E1C
MTNVVHLRIASGDVRPVAYTVESTAFRGVDIDTDQWEITTRSPLSDPAGPEQLWEELRRKVAAEMGEGPDAPGLWILRPVGRELCDVEWERLAREEAARREAHPVSVLRTGVGAGGFQPGEPLPFRDLSVRVLVVGVDVRTQSEGDLPWHEDVAVHTAVGPHAGRWEVEVLPAPVDDEKLIAALRKTKPHVLHLAGGAARSLFQRAPHDLGRLNLSSVRLIVSTSEESPAEAHRLLEPYIEADAPYPALAAVSVTAGSTPAPDLCAPLTELYGAMIAGESLDAAVRSMTRSDARVSALVTVNCRPELVLPTRKAAPRGGGSDAPDLYTCLNRVTDRVPQRLSALEHLEGGADVKEVVVLSGRDADTPIGTTCLMLSTLRVWEERSDRRALYLNFRRRTRNAQLRVPAPPRSDSAVTETVSLLVESVRAQLERHGDWDAPEELAELERLLAKERGEYRTRTKTVRDELVRGAIDLLVKLAPPGTHLALALDHFGEDEKHQGWASFLVRDLFDVVLNSASAVSVVVTARDPARPETADWLNAFVARRCTVLLERWKEDRGAPLLRELGTRMGYDWHNPGEWRQLMTEQLEMIEGDFGPQFLNDVYSAAVSRFG